MRILIKNGRVIDPASGTDGIYDVMTQDNVIVKVEKNIADNADEIIDAANCLVMPGLIDLHVHLREPGFEHKETIETGVAAAARGGFTTICAMPNTNPVTDCTEIIEYVINKAKEIGKVNVLPVGAITMGQQGEELTDILAMAKAGACAISEDGKSVMNALLYRRAMELAAKAGIPVLAHCEDKNLVGKGVLNQGDKSEKYNVQGISNAVEDVIVARDILLAKETGARLHLCHCSTKDSVKMVEDGKKDGVLVSAEVCPHHFAMSTDDIKSDNSNYKMNPPLRTTEDVEALRNGLHNNVMDVIATDHAPHSAEEKARPIADAPFGIVGLETAVALTITKLLKPGYISEMQMAEKLSYNPAKILGIDRGTLEVGKIADITVIDPDKTYTIDTDSFLSKGKNTPFDGMEVTGDVICTIANGNIIYKN